VRQVRRGEAPRDSVGERAASGLSVFGFDVEGLQRVAQRPGEEVSSLHPFREDPIMDEDKLPEMGIQGIKEAAARARIAFVMIVFAWVLWSLPSTITTLPGTGSQCRSITASPSGRN
jgi:hypothetical protein